VLIDEFSTFTVNSQRSSEGGGSNIKIAGHPATVTTENDVVVAEGSGGDDEGVLKAYTSSTEETQIAIKLLTALIPKFSH
jgi:hypothetical protein